jgi:hypothetical protein
MMEGLPEEAQEQIVEYLRNYIEDLRDDIQWDDLFRKTQPQLVAAARRARQEMDEAQANRQRITSRHG